jgi:hypothetical protein
MTSNDDPMFDPRIADWLEAGPTKAPSIVLETVLAAVPSIPQRRARTRRWRFFPLLTPARLLAPAIIALVAVVAGLAIIGRSQGIGSPPSPSASSHRIAFVRDGVHIFTMNDDGSDVTPLGNTTFNAWDPAWSPDGQQMAFASDLTQVDPTPSAGSIATGTQIYTMHADGSVVVDSPTTTFPQPGRRGRPTVGRSRTSGPRSAAASTW